MPKNNAGAMKMTETRIAHVRHFLVEDDAVIEDFIAVKCAASELMRPMSLDKKTYGGGAYSILRKKFIQTFV